MRAPSSDLPLVLAGVSLEAGATKILDSLNLADRAGPADTHCRTERGREDEPAADLHGAFAPVGRPHHLGRLR